MTIRRYLTLAALTLLNDPSFVEAARSLAVRMFRHDPDPKQRVQFGFELATGRRPTGAETAALVRLWSAEERRFAARPMAIEQLRCI